MSDNVEATGYRVWDAVVRISHWLFVAAVIALWWSGEEGEMDLHSLIGYGVLVLVLTRFIWGIVGSHHARFAQFLAGPRRIRAYLRAPAPTPGHNPLGGWSALALLLSLLVQSVTGLFNSDDILFEGPLAYWGGDVSPWLAQIHEVNWGVLQGLIALHVVAIVYYQWRKRQPLIQAMVLGRAPGKVSAVAPRHWGWAVPVIIALAGLLWWVIENAPTAPSSWY